MVSLLWAGAPAGSPPGGVGLLPCCQNPRCHDRLGDCCCPWCLLGNFTAGRTLMAHMSVVVVVLWVKVADGDGCEAGRAAPIAEAAPGLSPLPHGAMGSLPALRSLAPLPCKWQKGAEIHWPGDSVRRRVLPARCTGCFQRGDNVAKGRTDGDP